MSKKTIALIDWNWMGHHPTYFTEFAAAMARADAEVVPFCANPEDFNNRLSEMAENHALRNRICIAEHVNGPKPSKFRPARWRGNYEAIRLFGGLGRQLRDWERQNNRKIDLVFFACIYDWEFAHFSSSERFFGFPWTGLYLHARSLRMPGMASPYRTLIPRPEKVFGGRLLRSIALLDEGVIEKMRLITRSGNVFAFPDVANESLPKEGALNWGLAHKIKDFAAGRKIVTLVGYLQQTKGVEEFVELAKHPSMRNTIFFLGGEPGLDGFDEATKSRLQNAWEQTPNLWAHLQRLPEESLNAVVASSDVVFAAYRNFPNSSNIMTKAAMFERPIVVSDGFLMAERVRHYCLGEVVPEGDVQVLAYSVAKMLEPNYINRLRSDARWADYKKDHSAASLEHAMKSLLAASV